MFKIFLTVNNINTWNLLSINWHLSGMASIGIYQHSSSNIKRLFVSNFKITDYSL